MTGMGFEVIGATRTITTTDSNGDFNINGIYEGNYNVIAGSWGFITSCTNEFISTSSNNQIILLEGYYDDFTFDFGWTVTGGASSANEGIWQRGNPEGTDYNGSNFNPDDDVNNDCYDYAYVTGLASGSQVGDNDVDDYNTILTSPIFDLFETYARGLMIVASFPLTDLTLSYGVAPLFMQARWACKPLLAQEKMGFPEENPYGPTCPTGPT